MSQKIIDFHAHILHHKLWDVGKNDNVLSGFGIREIPDDPSIRMREEFELCFNPEAQIAKMDRCGVDVHLISSSTVMQGTQWAAPREELELCQLMNDYMKQNWIDRHPDRFIGSMILPFQDLSLALAEMERCSEDLGYKVVNAPARIGDDYLSAPKFDEYWSKAEKLGVVTFIHPMAPPIPGCSSTACGIPLASLWKRSRFFRASSMRACWTSTRMRPLLSLMVVAICRSTWAVWIVMPVISLGPPLISKAFPLTIFVALSLISASMIPTRCKSSMTSWEPIV